MEIRPPDASILQRLLEDDETEEDPEMSEALEISRREFLFLQKRLEEEEREKQRLRKSVALPLSRLRLWKRTCRNTPEKEFLDFIINRVNHRLYNDLENMPTLPHAKKEEFTLFLRKELSSKQYEEVVNISQDCTNRSPFKSMD